MFNKLITIKIVNDIMVLDTKNINGHKGILKIVIMQHLQKFKSSQSGTVIISLIINNCYICFRFCIFQL